MMMSQLTMVALMAMLGLPPSNLPGTPGVMFGQLLGMSDHLTLTLGKAGYRCAPADRRAWLVGWSVVGWSHSVVCSSSLPSAGGGVGRTFRRRTRREGGAGEGRGCLSQITTLSLKF